MIIISINTYSQKNMILYLPFDNNLKDFSEKNNDGVAIGNISYGEDRFGNPCSAAYFKGQEYITIQNSKSLNAINDKFSLTTWFKIEKGSDDYLWLTLVCKGNLPDETNTSPHFRVQVLQTNTQSTVSINSEFTEYDNDYKNHLFIPGKWMFFSLTYDGKNVITYLNGKKTWEFPYLGKLYSNSSPLYIGKDIPGATESFTGYLDELKLFNTDLSEKEINKLFNDKAQNNQTNLKVECPSNITVNTEQGKCGAIVNYLNSYSTNCGTAQTELLKGLKSGSFFNTGNNEVIFKIANNGNLKICRFNIKVNDNEKPKIICPDDYEVLIDSNSFVMDFIEPTVTDNCGIKSLTEMEYNGSFKVEAGGIYHPTFEVIDINGNKSNCTYKVSVKKKKQTVAIPEKEKISKTKIDDNKTELKDSIVYKDKLSFKSKYIIAEIYDDMIEDNDTISVYYNDIEIIHYRMVRKMGNNTIILNLELKKNKKNNIVIKAWNMGDIPPNTVKIDFYETDTPNNKKIPRRAPLFSKILHSKPGISSAIWLNLK